MTSTVVASRLTRPAPRAGFAARGVLTQVDVRRGAAPRLTRRGRLLLGLLLLTVATGLFALAASRLGQVAAAQPLPTAEQVPTVSVVVQPGDSLWAIATRLNKGSDPRQVVAEIREENGLAGNQIMPGDVLVVPLHS